MSHLVTERLAGGHRPTYNRLTKWPRKQSEDIGGLVPEESLFLIFAYVPAELSTRRSNIESLGKAERLTWSGYI